MRIAALLVLCLFGCADGEPRRPNILFIVADDLGYGDLGCYGGEDVVSPHLDALARQGVLLTDFYVASPMCSPSRASLLTGRYPERHGLRQALTERASTDGLDPDQVLLPELLRGAGYVTGLVGKWHLGTQPEHLPTRRGFDEFYGMLRASSGYFSHDYQGIPDLWDGEAPVDRDGEYSTEIFSDGAIDFVERHRDEPWFLMLSYNAPHLADDRTFIPSPEEWRQQFARRKGKKKRREFLSALAAMDDGIGQVLEALDALDLADDTLVVFLSDNGSRLPYGSNEPYRGRKDTLAEGGIHVPAIVRWPGRVRAGTRCSLPIIAMDFTATALALAGAPSSGPALDGLDVRSVLTADANTQDVAQRPLFWNHESRRTANDGSFQHDRVVRQGRWRLTVKSDGTTLLHDLRADPGQQAERSGDEPEVVRDAAYTLGLRRIGEAVKAHGTHEFFNHN